MLERRIEEGWRLIWYVEEMPDDNNIDVGCCVKEWCNKLEQRQFSKTSLGNISLVYENKMEKDLIMRNDIIFKTSVQSRTKIKTADLGILGLSKEEFTS